MKFAIVNGNKMEASKGAKGQCQNCGMELIAKCGEFKINHWAHKAIRNCDSWWEPETEWHRSWKNHFPIEWQESILFDSDTGEKHIADIRTTRHLVIEFQHSHLNPNERKSREKFYKNMVWIVDGTRLKRDYDRFIGYKTRMLNTNRRGIVLIESVTQCLPRTWSESSVPVVFDFKGLEEIKYAHDMRSDLYCLFPFKNRDGHSILARISRNEFIRCTANGQWINFINSFIKK
jgi:competence protein CoiA